MAYQNEGPRPQRQMVDVSELSIKCAECGETIKELPFNPTKRDDGTYGKLYCYECNKKRMQSRGPRNFGGGDRA